VPEEVLLDEDPDYEDAPVAIIGKELAAILKGEGVVFGRNIPRAPAIRRLAARGGSIEESQLAELLEEAAREARSVQHGEEHLKLDSLAATPGSGRSTAMRLARAATDRLLSRGGARDPRSGWWSAGERAWPLEPLAGLHAA
jgi:hypothetical protein